MQTDRNELQVQGRLSERCDTVVAGWAKRWNHYGRRSALSCHCVGEETDLPFIKYREEVDYERWLVNLLPWMSRQGDGLGDKSHLNYFFVSVQFDRVWFVDHHKYWAHDCDFEMRMRTNCGLIKVFVGWHSVEVVALPPLDRPRMYMCRCRTGGLARNRVANCWCRRCPFLCINRVCFWAVLRLTRRNCSGSRLQSSWYFR